MRRGNIGSLPIIPSPLNCGLTAWQSFIGILLFLDKRGGVVWYMKWIFGGVPFWGNSQIVHVAKWYYFQNFFRFFCCNFENALIADAHYAAMPNVFLLWFCDFEIFLAFPCAHYLRSVYNMPTMTTTISDTTFFVFAFWPWLPPNRPTLTYWLIKKKKMLFGQHF